MPQSNRLRTVSAAAQMFRVGSVKSGTRQTLRVLCLLTAVSVPTAPRALPAQTEWTLFEETSIAGRISGSIKKGHIFRTTSGSIYELAEYVYLYKYLYRPPVIVLRNGDLYRLVIEGFDEPLMCRSLRGPEGDVAQYTTPGSGVIESFIVSDFDGLDQGNVYKLANGQIWEQTEAWVWVWIWVMPEVQIWESGGVWKMKVQGIDHVTIVRQLK